MSEHLSAPAKAITIGAVVPVAQNRAFTVQGTLAGYTAPPTLVYSDSVNTGLGTPGNLVATATTTEVDFAFSAVPDPSTTVKNWAALPTAGLSVTATTFAFTHPGVMTPGPLTFAVADKASLGIMATATIPINVVIPSKDGATVLVPNFITGIDGTKWSITPGGQVTADGMPWPGTANVVELFYQATSGRVYQQNASGGWWWIRLVTDGWTAGTNPAV